MAYLKKNVLAFKLDKPRYMCIYLCWQNTVNETI